MLDSLSDNPSYLSLYSGNDKIDEVPSNETKVGYLYFDDAGYNYAYLIYTFGELGNKSFYNFDLK